MDELDLNNLLIQTEGMSMADNGRLIIADFMNKLKIKDKDAASMASSQNSPRPVDNILDDNIVCCIDDMETIAKENLNNVVYDYYRTGADEEKTLVWNRKMIGELYALKSRIMVNVSKVRLSTYVLGDKVSLPIGISPSAMHKLAHVDGELATIRACKRANTVMVLSLFSTVSLEQVAKEEPTCTKWQNIYILKNRELTRNIIDRARRFGYRALVVTCDAPVLGKRRRDEKNKLELGIYPLANIEDASKMSMKDHAASIFDSSVTWQDLADIKTYVGDSMKVIAKGVMSAEDAEEAIHAKVDAIFVSNHGGRQLDGIQSTIEVLPSIVKTVNKRVPIFVDGGFRTGADILKALALGADMVFIGRPILWGLATAGENGIYRALEILEDELRRAMMLCGCKNISDIGPHVVVQRNSQ